MVIRAYLVEKKESHFTIDNINKWAKINLIFIKLRMFISIMFRISKDVNSALKSHMAKINFIFIKLRNIIIIIMFRISKYVNSALKSHYFDS